MPGSCAGTFFENLLAPLSWMIANHTKGIDKLIGQNRTPSNTYFVTWGLLSRQ